jgi:tRNA A58 N-methylase Trm61
MDFMNILVDFQHGFRNKRSCESQLVITTEDIARNLDNNQQVDMLILDFSKAFDMLEVHKYVMFVKMVHYMFKYDMFHDLARY